MTDDEAAEVRAAMALPGWWLAEGVLDSDGWRVGAITLHDGARAAQRRGEHRQYHYPQVIDPHDNATAGVLLAMLGAGASEVSAEMTADGRWHVERVPSFDTAALGCSPGLYAVHAEGPSLGMAVIRCAIARGRWGAP